MRAARSAPVDIFFKTYTEQSPGMRRDQRCSKGSSLICTLAAGDAVENPQSLGA